MNKITKEQLNKVMVADISNYNEQTGVIHIPKYTEVRYEVDNYYLIKLDDLLLIPEGNPSLIANWNKGLYPRCKFLKVDVSKVLGKMIYVTGIGYNFETNEDLNYIWTGWLPTQQISLVKKL